MKQLLLTITLLITFSVSANEDTWSIGSVTFPTLGNTITGYITNSGNFRMDTLGKTKAEIKISGGYFTKYKKTAATFCSSVGSTLDTTKFQTKHTYSLSGFAYPLADNEISQSELKIENKPNLVRISVKLTPLANSFLDISVAREFETSLAKVLNSNLSRIAKSGEFNVELSQVDDVMCDLILGQSKLEINYTVSFELAKHIRTVLITPNDFSVVYEALRKTENKASSIAQKNLIFGAHLTRIFKSELNKPVDELGQDNFLRIASSMIDTEKASLKNILASQYEAMARSTDDLDIYSSPANQSVQLNLRIQEK